MTSELTKKNRPFIRYPTKFENKMCSICSGIHRTNASSANMRIRDLLRCGLHWLCTSSQIERNSAFKMHVNNNSTIKCNECHTQNNNPFRQSTFFTQTNIIRKNSIAKGFYRQINQLHRCCVLCERQLVLVQMLVCRIERQTQLLFNFIFINNFVVVSNFQLIL